MSSSKFSVLGALQYFLDPSHTKLGIKVRRGCFWSKSDLRVNLTGKVAVVSGANSGIGKATADGLAARGATVHMLCRSLERGTLARDAIKKNIEKVAREEDGDGGNGGGDAILHVVDLSEPDQIKKFARDFKAKNERLDILVNNAAVMPNALASNSKGTEVALATNLAGFYGLTMELSDLLVASEARVVNVVSAGMFAAKLSIPVVEKGLRASTLSLENYSGIELYSQHHRARVMLTDYLAKQWQDKGVTVNSVHPGWVDTPGLKGAKDMESFTKTMGNLLRTEQEGADTVLWLAMAEKAKHSTGKYWFDRKSRKKHKLGAGTQSTEEELEQLVDVCKKAFDGMP